MTDGRQLLRSDLPPVASEVTDATYCFPEVYEKEAPSIRLLCAGRERCLSDYHVSRCDYPCFVIEFIFEGKGKLRIGNETHDLYPGVIASYGLDIPHDLWADTAHPMSKYFVAYTCEDRAKLESMKSIHPGQVRCSLDMNALQILFQELITEGRRSGEVHQLLCEKYLDLILLKSSVAYPVNEENENGGFATFQRTQAYIEQHFIKLSSLADLAKAVDLDSTYLCRIFRRFGQESPHLCIMRHKINRAAELLVQETSSVKEIASQVGYEDPFHFSRLFKKRFGDSPTSFRKGLRNLAASERKI